MLIGPLGVVDGVLAVVIATLKVFLEPADPLALEAGLTGGRGSSSDCGVRSGRPSMAAMNCAIV
jgi:hypothetical protein